MKRISEKASFYETDKQDRRKRLKAKAEKKRRCEKSTARPRNAVTRDREVGGGFEKKGEYCIDHDGEQKNKNTGQVQTIGRQSNNKQWIAWLVTQFQLLVVRRRTRALYAGYKLAAAATSGVDDRFEFKRFDDARKSSKAYKKIVFTTAIVLREGGGRGEGGSQQ